MNLFLNVMDIKWEPAVENIDMINFRLKLKFNSALRKQGLGKKPVDPGLGDVGRLIKVSELMNELAFNVLLKFKATKSFSDRNTFLKLSSRGAAKKVCWSQFE